MGQTPSIRRPLLGSETSWLWVLIIALVAILLRTIALDRLPPGLFGDEAVEGLDALDVMAGNLSIWFHAHLGREPLFVYLVALSYQFFGVTPFATRLPALFAGLLTLPATFFFVQEWSKGAAHRQGRRLALLTCSLLAISFWHLQMTRDAHRVVLLPLVEAVGFGLLWRALRTRRVRDFVASGAILGIAVYTYSPGRFVGIFIVLFLAVELVLRLWNRAARRTLPIVIPQWDGLAAAALAAILVMLPLGLYFVQNPVQFGRRFESVSILDAESPAGALAESITGNLAQFVLPGAGYQSRHYNLPGRPIFDFWIAPWFIVGWLVVGARLKQPAYRFLALWFLVMMAPAFLTSDMIPKAVRGLGVVPGVFVFAAIAMQAAIEHAKGVWKRALAVLVALSLWGSLVSTVWDYAAWGSLPELPLAFDADMVEASAFIKAQPAGRPVYLSAEVYRHPTLMLLGENIPTSRYNERAVGVREFDARVSILSRDDERDPVYLFVRDRVPPEDWIRRLAPESATVEKTEFLTVYHVGALAAPQQRLEMVSGSYMKLTGFSVFDGEPQGMALYWQVTEVGSDRTDAAETLNLFEGARPLSELKRRFGVAPMEWAVGDRIVEWYSMAIPPGGTDWTVKMVYGSSSWESPRLTLHRQ